MVQNSESNVGILVTYWIDGEDCETYSSKFSDIDAQRQDIEMPKRSKLTPGDYNYSGRHDHGELPPLREQVELGKLLCCVKEAKDHNDRFVTEKIQAFKSRRDIKGDRSPPTKKTKV